MVDLNFQVEGADPIPDAATPQLAFHLRIRDAGPPAQIQSVLLRVQIRIEPTRRGYGSADSPELRELFGERDTWGRTMRSFLWTNASLFVPGFSEETLVDLNVPCSIDFDFAATKYFDALEDGEFPLSLLFSGTVFVDTEQGLRAMPISWEREAKFRLPVETWHAMIERYYPNRSFISLNNETFKQLYRYRSRNGLLSWDQTIEQLLRNESESVPLSCESQAVHG